METIAITNWNKIVSPLYDSACCLLIFKSDGSDTSIDISNFTIAEKAFACKEAGVNILICGAISNIGNAALLENGVKVVSWISGPVADIIASFRNNKDITSLYSMPGCRRRICKGRKQRNRGNCFSSLIE